MVNQSVKNTLEELEETYASESKHVSEEIKALVGEYNEKVAANSLPEILILQTFISSQINTPVTDDKMDALSKVNGTLHNNLMQVQG